LGWGIGLVVGASVGGLVTALGLWRRLPASLAYASLAICGAAVAAGGLLMQDAAGKADWIVAVPVLAAVAPLHSRILFGPPGGAADARVVAEGPGAA
jgi:hypothetical protein